jgi:oligo-1,6-glucosidase
MRGTAFYYNGDELGMTNAKFNTIDDYQDVDTRNRYFGLKQKGGDLAAFLEDQKQTSRENSRTPFQWNSSVNSGFTTGKPWLKVNQNFATINAESQEKDPNSVLNYFRKLVKLRKSNPVLIYGKYTLLDRENPKVFAFTRELEGKKILVLLNFSAENATVNTEIDPKKYKIINSNYNYLDLMKNSLLRPYEALIIEIN